MFTPFRQPDRAARGTPPAYTCWETMTNARETNYGARIDYILATPALVPGDPSASVHRFVSCTLLRTVLGSDHCPVQGDLEGRRTRRTHRHTVCEQDGNAALSSTVARALFRSTAVRWGRAAAAAAPAVRQVDARVSRQAAVVGRPFRQGCGGRPTVTARGADARTAGAGDCGSKTRGACAAVRAAAARQGAQGQPVGVGVRGAARTLCGRLFPAAAGFPGRRRWRAVRGAVSRGRGAAAAAVVTGRARHASVPRSAARVTSGGSGARGAARRRTGAVLGR